MTIFHLRGTLDKGPRKREQRICPLCVIKCFHVVGNCTHQPRPSSSESVVSDLLCVMTKPLRSRMSSVSYFKKNRSSNKLLGSPSYCYSNFFASQKKNVFKPFFWQYKKIISGKFKDYQQLIKCFCARFKVAIRL